MLPVRKTVCVICLLFAANFYWVLLKTQSCVRTPLKTPVNIPAIIPVCISSLKTATTTPKKIIGIEGQLLSRQNLSFSHRVRDSQSKPS
jgi:hypothetical protein